jgi:hypothetical protein
MSLYRSDGTPFANVGQCVSYGAHGGTVFSFAGQGPCESFGGTFSTDPATNQLPEYPGYQFVWSCNDSPATNTTPWVEALIEACLADGGDNLAWWPEPDSPYATCWDIVGM